MTTDHKTAWMQMIESLNAKNQDTTELNEDFEADMAVTELKSISDKADQLVELMKEMKMSAGAADVELDAWIQSKITKCNDYMNSVYDYMMYSEDDD
jgi:hypothetical protein